MEAPFDGSLKSFRVWRAVAQEVLRVRSEQLCGGNALHARAGCLALGTVLKRADERVFFPVVKRLRSLGLRRFRAAGFGSNYQIANISALADILRVLGGSSWKLLVFRSPYDTRSAVAQRATSIDRDYPFLLNRNLKTWLASVSRRLPTSDRFCLWTVSRTARTIC